MFFRSDFVNSTVAGKSAPMSMGYRQDLWIKECHGISIGGITTVSTVLLREWV